MKNSFSCRAFTGSIQLASAALCLTLFSVPAIADALPHADSVKHADETETGKKGRLISLVLLFHAPRELDEHTVGNLVSKALGVDHSHDETHDNFVVAKPPYYLVKLKSGSYVINNIAKPYIGEDDKMLEDLTEPALRKAVSAHHAWVSIDWASPEEPADVQRCYQDMGKIAAALAGHDALAIYNPEIDDFTLYSESVARTLRSEDPLQAFAGGDGGAGGSSDVISIRDDDPRLLAAQAEAKEGWHDFVHAFRDKEGEEFAVKGRIGEGDKGEYLWLTVDAIDETEIHGRLDNDPAKGSNLKMGQDLHIKIGDVDDWIYLNSAKKPVGGFTIKLFDKMAQKPPTEGPEK